MGVRPDKVPQPGDRPRSAMAVLLVVSMTVVRSMVVTVLAVSRLIVPVAGVVVMTVAGFLFMIVAPGRWPVVVAMLRH
jgi:hypothetical protein